MARSSSLAISGRTMPSGSSVAPNSLVVKPFDESRNLEGCPTFNVTLLIPFLSHLRHGMLVGHVSGFGWLNVGAFLNEAFGLPASLFSGEIFKYFSLSLAFLHLCCFSHLCIFFIFCDSLFMWLFLSPSLRCLALSFSSTVLFLSSP